MYIDSIDCLDKYKPIDRCIIRTILLLFKLIIKIHNTKINNFIIINISFFKYQ